MKSVDFLSQLADYLAREGLGSSLVAPVNIFVNKYPDQPDNMIALVGNSGQPPSVYIPEFEYPRFQIVIRDMDYITGAGKLRAIRQVLHDKLMVTTENFVALYIQADSEGGSIGEDNNGRAEFTINFRAQIRSDSIS